MLGRAEQTSCNFLSAIFFSLAIASCFCVSRTRADIPVISNAKAVENAKLPLPELVDVKFGWNGAYRVGSPTICNIILKSEAEFNGILNVTVRDADGDSIQYGPLYWFMRNSNGETVYPVTMQAPAKAFELKIELKIIPLGTTEMQQRQDAKSDFQDFPVSAEWTWNSDPSLALASVREIWLEVGSSLKLKNIVTLSSHDERNQPAIIASNSTNENYDQALYAGIQGVALNTFMYPQKGQELPDTHTLEKWVKEGGALFLNLKENQDNDAGRRAYFDESWNKFLGGSVTAKRVPHTQFSVWESFLGTDVPLGINEQLRRNPPLIPVLSDLKAKVLLADGDTPLVIEHQLGLGRVVTCLVDLNADPWRNWPKRDELLQRLIPWHITTDAESKFASSSSSLRLGYDDLAGQFVTALGTFKTVRMTPFWILMSAALGFGAVWYFVQSALLKSWNAASRLAFATLVVTASAVGFTMLVGGFTTSERLLANAAQVVDYNAAQGEYQGQSWLSLLSSNPRQVDLQATVSLPATLKSKTLAELTQQLEWLGMPGKGWGGLDAPLATWTQAGEPYRIDSRGAAVQDLTLSPDLTKSFHEHWRLPVEEMAVTPLIKHPGESLPRGTLKSELPFVLQDAILLYDTWGVELGTVQPGQVIDLDQIRGRVAAATTIITGKRAQPTAPVQSYDRTNTDVPQILKLLLLHRAAGGTRYTGLFSRAWPLLDQSSSLTENQALILGSGPAPVQWKVGRAGEKLVPLDTGDNVCWYRLWLPVVPNEEATSNASGPTIIRLPK